MDHRQRGHALRIRQVLEKFLDLRRQQQTLIDYGSTAQRRDIEEVLIPDVRRAHFVLGPLPDDVQFPL